MCVCRTMLSLLFCFPEMSDIFVSRDRWICENRVSLGVKEISRAETQILSVRFPFHRVRGAYSEGGE